jgi:hypothetical protein
VRIRLVAAADAEEPQQPAAALVVSRERPGPQHFGEPVLQPLPDPAGATPGWEQVITVPAGEMQPLFVTVEAVSLPEDGAPLPYTLQIISP